MAGLSSVGTALFTSLVTALGLPNGYSANTLAASSVLGISIRLFRGWPQATVLDADLIAGAGQVSIFPAPGMARLATRYLGAQVDTLGTATMTATIVGQTITLAGTPTASQTVGVALGKGYALAAYAYRILTGATLTTVAAGLAALIPGASSSGAVITVTQPIAYARVGVDGTSVAETRRVDQAFRIGLWMPTPDMRDLAGDTLDAAFAALPFIATAAGEAVRLKYTGTQVFDAPSKDRLWRSDVNFTAEYATTVLSTSPAMLFGADNITGGAGATLALVA